MKAGALARSLWHRAASRRLSVVLALALALYALLLTIWAMSSPATTVRSIASGVPFLAAYALLAVNLVACSLEFFPAVLARSRVRGAARPLGREVEVEVPELGSSPEERLSAALSKIGARRVLRVDGGVLGVRSPLAPIGSTIFHAGLLVLAAGLWLSARGRVSGEAILARGQPFSGSPGEYVSTGGPEGSPPPEMAFEVEDIGASFFGNAILFTDLWARLRMADGSEPTVRLSDPARSGTSWVSITGYAYAPEFVVRDASGAELASAVVRLQSFPPGQQDGFDLPGLPHRVYVEVYPDYVPGPGGQPESRGPAPGRDVRLRAVVLRQRVPVASAVVALGEPLAFDGLTLTFTSLEPMGTFRVVRDPGWPWVMAGLFAALLGLAWRLVRPRVDVFAAVAPGAPGRLRVRVRGDLLPADPRRWAERIARALSEGA